MRATPAVVIAFLAALAAAPTAPAHGGEIVSRAIEGLGRDPVYVDPAAVPTLEPAQVAQLRDQIDDAGGRIYVAVLPADAMHELATADAVLDAVAAAIGGRSAFAVLVGGQFRAASVVHPERAEELEAELVADTAATPEERLERFVAGIDDARAGAPTGSAALVAGAVAAALLVVAAVGLLTMLRRRRSPPASPEGAL